MNNKRGLTSRFHLAKKIQKFAPWTHFMNFSSFLGYGFPEKD